MVLFSIAIKKTKKLNQIFLSKVSRVTIYVTSLILVIAYGFKMRADWGTDYGIYYVGAMSINPEFGLYESFFDHKGPVIYGIVKVIGSVVKYSINGAIITLMIIGFIWVSSALIATTLLSQNGLIKATITFVSSLTIISQSSNSSLGLLLAGTEVLILICAIKFRRTKENRFINISSTLVAVSLLTRIDAILIIPITVFIICYKNSGWKRIISRYFIVTSFSFVGFLYIFSRTLHFSIKSYWYEAVVFNLFQYPKFYNSEFRHSKAAVFRTLTENQIALSLVAILSLVVLYVLFSRETKFNLPISIFIYGLFFYYFIGSTKDYHVFILFPFLITALILILNELKLNLLDVAFIIATVAAILVNPLIKVAPSTIFRIGQISNVNPYPEIISSSKRFKSDNVIYMIGQGWPYLLSNEKAQNSFVPYFPALFNIPTASNKLVADLNKNKDEYVWINKQTYALFLKDKKLARSKLIMDREVISRDINGNILLGPLSY